MKKCLLVCVLGLASCGGNISKKNDTLNIRKGISDFEPNTLQRNSEYCFLRTEGAGGEDITLVSLVITGHSVNGHMDWIPKEKDSRRGVLAGSLSDTEIKAVWSYMQEGVRDSMNVMFKLSRGQLAQKALKVNPADGRQETDEAADFTLVYKPVMCK